MEAIEFFGYLGALLIGVVLGLIGGGGSILTVPLLVYLLNINPVDATAYSLFLVGITALFGTIQNTRLGLVDFKTAFIFSLPAFSAVYMTRAMVVPNIPEIIYKSETLVLTKEVFIMVFFAAIMILAAVTMIRDQKVSSKSTNQAAYGWIALEGIVVGFVTGIVGAGGGFLIIPALVLLGGLPIKKAVATSLLIIAIKSLIGFIGDLQHITVDWNFLLLFSILSMLGIFIGGYFNRYISGQKLKALFGWFVLLMGIGILLKELT